VGAREQALWRPLVNLAGRSAGGTAPAVDDLLLAKLDVLMGVAWQHRARPPSALNNDGSPLELCLSACAKGVKQRLIGDPHLGLPVHQRVPASLAAARHLIRLTRSTALAPAFDLLVAHTIPPTPAEQAALPAGAVWLGCAIDDEPGFAAYTNIEWCGDQHMRWQCALAWLKQATVAFDEAALAPWRHHWTPFAAGLEGDRPDRARVKLYFRQAEDTPFLLTMLAGLEDPVVAAFCAGVIQGRTLPRSGIVLSTEFAVATGKLMGTKLDICGHCTPRTGGEWQDFIAGMAATAGVASLPLAHLGPAMDVAFIGIGRRGDDDYRLNVYLKHEREVG
jgi:hypothetical protein